MRVLGSAVSRRWGEAMWTARDLLKQPVPVSIVIHPREPDTRYVPFYLWPPMRPLPYQ